jgi:hypothetical protein
VLALVKRRALLSAVATDLLCARVAGPTVQKPSAKRTWPGAFAELVRRYVLCVSDGPESATAPTTVTRVYANVDLESTVWTELAVTPGDDPGESRRLIQISGNPEHLNLHVSLSAEDGAGRRIRTVGRDFGIGAPRRGGWHRWHGPPLPDDREEADRIVLIEHRVDLHDIEDGINQMLGRDPS